VKHAASPAPPALAFDAGAARETSARPSLVDRVYAWRDALVASPRFQRWAAAFPLTRGIALRRSRKLFDLCAGFVYSQTLLAAHRTGMFAALAEGPLGREALRLRLGLDADAAERLIGASMALGLVERRPGGRIGLGPLGAPMVGNAALAAMLEHNALLYDDLRDPVALLRDGGDRLARYWSYAPDAPAPEVASYSALMSASQPLVAAELLDAYDVSRHRRLLDVGGGEGTFLRAAAARSADLHLSLFDLPPVAERARASLRAAGLEARSTVHAGDFLRDELPAGADLATLVRVLHDHPDDDVRALLGRVHRALAPGGTLVIAEPMAGVRGAETVGAAYFAFYLRAMGRGRARTPEEYREMLRETGFRQVRALRPRLPVQASVIIARK
jgi:demethylspheroidene O-methyltransferase